MKFFAAAVAALLAAPAFGGQCCGVQCSAVDAPQLTPAPMGTECHLGTGPDMSALEILALSAPGWCGSFMTTCT